MNKQPKRRTKTPAKAKQPPAKAPTPLKWSRYAVFLLAFALYAQTLAYDYALDDTMVITRNQFVKEGLSGIGNILSSDSFTGYHMETLGAAVKTVSGGRYRPLSLISFAVEHQFFGASPGLSHFINTLLYALSCLLLYLILLRLLPYRKHSLGNVWLSVPFMTAVLFTTHPLHTEVVANIKGRDELLALLFPLLALRSFWLYQQKQKKNQLIYAMLFLFLGLMSKESSIVFVLIIPLTVYFFSDSKPKSLYTGSGLLAITAALFVLIRHLVLTGEEAIQDSEMLMNNPFMEMNGGQKAGTILYTLWLYVKLLFVPHPLTYDYYPYHIQPVPFASIRAIGPLLLYIGLVTVALLGLRRKSIYSYAIILFLGPVLLVSNILFPIGAFMAERFLYLPSVGFSLVLAWWIVRALPRLYGDKSRAALMAGILFGLIAGLYSVKTISRNPAWKNDFELNRRDAITSSGSAKSTATLGALYGEKYQQAQSPAEKKELFAKAIQYYRKALEINPRYVNIWKNMANLYVAEKQFAHVLECYHELYRLDNNNWDAVYHLGLYYGSSGTNLDSSLKYLEMARRMNPTDFRPYRDLGLAYGSKGQYTKALEMLNKSLQMGNKEPSTLKNIAVTYEKMGQAQKAAEYNQRYQQAMQNAQTP